MRIFNTRWAIIKYLLITIILYPYFSYAGENIDFVYRRTAVHFKHNEKDVFLVESREQRAFAFTPTVKLKINLKPTGDHTEDFPAFVDALRAAESEHVQKLLDQQIPEAVANRMKAEADGILSSGYSLNTPTVIVFEVDLTKAIGSEEPMVLTFVISWTDIPDRPDDGENANQRLNEMINYFFSEMDKINWDRLIPSEFYEDDPDGRTKAAAKIRNFLFTRSGDYLPVGVAVAYDRDLGRDRTTDLLQKHFEKLKAFDRTTRLDLEKNAKIALNYYNGNKGKALEAYKELAGMGDPLGESMLLWNEVIDGKANTMEHAKKAEKLDELLKEWGNLQDIPFGGITNRAYGLAQLDSEEVIAHTGNYGAYYRLRFCHVTATKAAVFRDVALAMPSVREHYSSKSERLYANWQLNVEQGMDKRNLIKRVEEDIFNLRLYAVRVYAKKIRVAPRDFFPVFERLDELGVIGAKNYVGIYHMEEILGDGSDFNSARKAFMEGAKLGDPFTFRNLACMDYFGIGGARNLDSARKFMVDARDAGFLSEAVFEDALNGKHPTTWRASNEAGDEMVVTLQQPENFPGTFGCYAGDDGEKPKNRLKYLVQYKIQSVEKGRIFPRDLQGDHSFSPCPELENHGEHIVWIAMPTPKILMQKMRITLVEATTRKAILDVEVPVVARWSNR